MLRAIIVALVALLASPASALVISGVRSAVTAPRAATPTLAMPNIEDAKNLTDEEIAQEIFNAKKELFELRKGVKTRQQVKPHLFVHTKHRIAQLNTLLGQRAASQ
uniref:Ribosomal protein L29 n=1 Tax=Coccolithus braarudii TaxID=221442 RepID=A0A7S0LCD3_9EUKA|mmetsp:Transcript_32610/g.69941  ORF Transcript_32610/g.69941 Transcript_32610/m.69941 type:complete len:106 (+) Transcript_32610:120-437(+)